MTSDAIDVELSGEPLGHIEQTAAGARWHASDEALERYGVGSTVLSLGLPLTAEPARVAATEAFFGGLLPEGARLDALIRETPGARRDHMVSLLAAIGGDTSGALAIPGPSTTSLGPLLSAEEVAAEVANPRGYVAGGGSGLAGMQHKTAFGRSEQGWHAAIDGHPSTHIVKPVSPENARAAHAEVWLMGLARTVGIAPYEVWLEEFGPTPAVVAERFDRKKTSTGGYARLHQEDAAQALGLAWGGDAKFEWSGSGASLRSIAGLLDRRRTVRDTGPSDRQRLLEHTVFRLIVGDTDGHAKNHALLHTKADDARLAPIYDVTPLVLNGAGGRIALTVDGAQALRDITAEELVTEAMSWGMREGEARETIARIATAARDAARDAAHTAHEAIARQLPGYVTQACAALLAGRSLHVDVGPHPWLDRLELA